jgi:hypothetical protein
VGRKFARSLIVAMMVAGAAPAWARDVEGVPKYDHIFVIVEENKDYAQILDPAVAPNIAGLARDYGNATEFFGEVHPSEANYVALLAGDTFGIHDDDAYYCAPGSDRPFCAGAKAADYADHTIRAPHLGDQLTRAGLTWKGYYETIPEPGSLAVVASEDKSDPATRQNAFYASKHSGFMNFADVQSAPDRAARIVGFDQLDRDMANGAVPNFALIVPNQCNEMHGLHGPGIPADCESADKAALIRRGDAYVGALVKRLQATSAWTGSGNTAIVITFDEGAGKTREGCCGVTPDAISNFGGGHIPTIVITNHGPRRASDATPYNHYALLRTIEDAFGIQQYLGHAADTADGVKPMTPLFSTTRAAQAKGRRPSSAGSGAK